MSRWISSVLAAAVAGGVWSNAGAAAPAAETFEALLEAAEPAPEWPALAAPFAVTCGQSGREIDKARCRGMQSLLEKRLPGRIFTAVVDDPAVVKISGFNAALTGYRVEVLGCLTCSEPASGPGGNPVQLTLKVPAGGSVTDSAMALARPTLTFASLDEAQAWQASAGPQLRAQFAFRPDGKAWSRGAVRGVAFEPVGMRIFNRCTGEVFFSSPPSTGGVAVQAGLDGCETPNGPAVADRGAAAGKLSKEGDENLPVKLGATEISAALRKTSNDVLACDARWKTAGSVDLEFQVPGTGGTAESVRAKGQLGGTEVADCLLQAARQVEFPKFQRARQSFKYTVRLSGK